jgi:hypothetical protein
MYIQKVLYRIKSVYCDINLNGLNYHTQNRRGSNDGSFYVSN